MSECSKQAYENLRRNGGLTRSQLAYIGSLYLLGDKKTNEDVAQFQGVKEHTISGRVSPNGDELGARGIILEDGKKKRVIHGENYPMTFYRLIKKNIYGDLIFNEPGNPILSADKIFGKKN